MGQNEQTIACMGDCNVDITVPIKKMPQKGGSTHTDCIFRGIGGSMLNVTTALNRLGVHAVPLTFIGTDESGDEIIDYLNANDISSEGVIRRKEYITGSTLALIEPDGEKYWISIRENAADLHMDLQPIFKELCNISNLFFVTGNVITEGPESARTAIALAKQCHENGGTVFIDPNLRVFDNRLDLAARNVFDRILPYTDILIPNEAELRILGESGDLKTAAKNILHRGVKDLWIKCGGNGSYFISGNRCEHFLPKPVVAVDTTAAGDTFTAAVIYCSIYNETIEKTGRFANELAGYTVTKYGSIEALSDVGMINQMKKEILQEI